MTANRGGIIMPETRSYIHRFIPCGSSNAHKTLCSFDSGIKRCFYLMSKLQSYGNKQIQGSATDR